MTSLMNKPLFLLSSGNFLEGSEKANPVLELLGILLIFCCVLYLAYVASRYIGKKFTAANKSRYINIVERVSLGVDKQLVLIRVGSEYYLFLSGKKDFKMVAKVAIDKEEIEQAQDDNEPNESVFYFRDIFDKYLNKNMKKPKTSKNFEKSNSLNKNEMLKENINRLKQMQEKSYDEES